MSFAELLRRSRSERGWTQEHVARLIGTHGSTVQKWELGETQLPRAQKLGKLISLFQWAPDTVAEILAEAYDDSGDSRVVAKGQFPAYAA